MDLSTFIVSVCPSKRHIRTCCLESTGIWMSYDYKSIKLLKNSLIISKGVNRSHKSKKGWQNNSQKTTYKQWFSKLYRKKTRDWGKGTSLDVDWLAISRRSVLLVEKTGVAGENHRSWIRTHNFIGDRHWMHKQL